MADISFMAKKYRDEGYSDVNADARVCQDIVLKAISESSLSRNVTIKGGVVIRGMPSEKEFRWFSAIRHTVRM